MNTITSNKVEWILAGLIAIEIFDICFPRFIPSGFVNIILLFGIIACIVCRLQNIDNSLKHKYWR